MTFALFRESAFASLSRPSAEGGLRRALSALYVQNYVESYRATYIWGIQALQYYEQSCSSVLHNMRFMQAICTASLLHEYLQTQEGYALVERAASFTEPRRIAFAVEVERIARGAQAIFRECVDSLGQRGAIGRVVTMLQEVSIGASNTTSHSYADALARGWGRLRQIAFMMSARSTAFAEAIQEFDTALKRVRLLITTATDTEDAVLMEVFSGLSINVLASDTTGISSLRFLGIHGDVEVHHVRSSAGSAGPAGAHATVSDVVSRLRPHLTISAGICFGLRPQKKKQQLCDIAISTQVRLYESQRLTGARSLFGRSKIVPRGNLLPASELLLDRSRAQKQSWAKCAVHEGIFMSGEKLVDDRAFVSQLLRLEPEAIAGEMEGSGVAAAVQRERGHWIIVKGICDWGFGKEKDHQRGAAANAFSFVGQLLLSGGLDARGALAAK